MNIVSCLDRAGIEACEEQIVFVEAAPAAIDKDVEREMGRPCVDAYYRLIPEVPLHLGLWLVWPEVEHWCQGGTKRTYHVKKAETDRPSGGELPQEIVMAISHGFIYKSPQETWECGEAEAKAFIQAGHGLNILGLVLAGDLGEEWLPEGTRGSDWGLGEMLPRAYERGVNPLPLLRRLMPKPEWGFSRTEVRRADKGPFPTHGDGDIISTWRVPGGWVYAQAPKGSAQDNSWM